MHFDGGIRTGRAVSWLAGVVLLVIALMSTSGGEAFGVVGGKTVPITAAPWTVVVWEPGYPRQPRYAACTGVIIDPRHILTAGHCVMYGESAKSEPPSDFTIEAGVSNFKHPLVSDHPQFRSVRTVRPVPGYIATRKVTASNLPYAAGHDLAVLTLSRPLDLMGDDARAADLPSANAREPSAATRLLMAGYGYESRKGGANGTLNEVAETMPIKGCSTSRELCVLTTPGTCLGDSGAGLVEPGRRPTVVGVLNNGAVDCTPDLDEFASLTSPAVLRFIKNGK